jgi:two-component system, chemotaxis family, sensor kinase CheA
VLGIGQRSGVLAEFVEQARGSGQQTVQPEHEAQRLLLFRAGSFARLAVPLSLVARLEEFPQSSIEHAGGGQVVQYRNRILPLVSLRSVLEPHAPDQDEPPDPVQVVVFNDRDSSVGMVVDEILDVTEEAVTVRQGSDRAALLGSAVVGKQVTDFLDLNQVIQATGGNWFQGIDGHAGGGRILIADASAFSRALVRGSLDMAAYAVLEAASLEQAIAKLEQQRVDVVLVALELPPDGGTALLASMRRRPEWNKIPVVALTNSNEQGVAAGAQASGFDACHPKFDRTLVLESVSRLISASTSLAVPPLVEA